jgi:hypothetical protein
MLGSTTEATLLSGGDFFAQVTPRASKRLKTADADSMYNIPNEDARSIFVDRDPDVFADVLYYMRCNTLPPGEAETDFAKLKKIQREAVFFVYDALIQVCNGHLEALIEEKKPKTATFCSHVVSWETPALQFLYCRELCHVNRLCSLGRRS